MAFKDAYAQLFGRGPTTAAPPAPVAAPAPDLGVSRADRNNNPGNLEDNDYTRGLPGYKGSDGRFAIFDSPESGQSAQVGLLGSYGRRGFNTVDAIVNRWSPQSDKTNAPGSTSNYAKYVAAKLGVDPYEPLDLSDPQVARSVASAMAEFESGHTSRTSALPRTAPAKPAGDPSFEDIAEETIGERPQYDPIRVTRLGATTRKVTGFEKAAQALAKLSPQKSAETGETSWFDEPKNFVAGTLQAAGDIVGAGEYAGRQLGEVGLTDVLGAARKGLYNTAGKIDETLTPEFRRRMALQLDTLDPTKSIWRQGVGPAASAITAKFTRSLPGTLLTLLPASRWMSAGMGPKALLYLGATEGTMSMGGVANQISQEIESMSEEDLQQQSPRYAQLLRITGSPAEARQQLITEAQGKAPLLAGVTVAAISSAAGRYLEPVFSGEGMPLLSRTGRGFASEFMQEAPQSGVEQYAQNVAAQLYDQDRSPWEGVRSATVEGGVVGGLSGGAFAGVLGHGPHPVSTPETDQTEEPQVTPSSPGESFESVFGQGGQQPGAAHFDDVFTMPGREQSTLDQLQARARYVANPQASLQRRSALGDAINTTGVDPDRQAALNAVRDGLQGDLFDQQQGPTPQQEQAAYLQKPFPFQQTEMDLPQAPVPNTQGVMVPSGDNQQLPLGLRARDERGRPVITPTPANPLVEDMSAPAAVDNGMLRRRPGISDYMAGRPNPHAGTFRDENQLDMFGEPIAAPAEDQPSAEPVGDLLAQLDDMSDPDSQRKGVYLSAANIENLRRNGAFEQVRGTGVPLANFDGQGGTLIAKNRQVAEELLAMRDEGAADMQEILGYATGAGSGKSATANIVVQQRDEAGNVVRESLVETPDEADFLADSWEHETGQPVQIISSAQALRRRTQRIAAEDTARTHQRAVQQTARTVERAAEARLGEGEQAEKVTQAAKGSATTASAARKLAREARIQRFLERRRRFRSKDRPQVAMGRVTIDQGHAVDPPEALNFPKAADAQRYAELFMEFVGTDINMRYGTVSERVKAQARQKELINQMNVLRQAAQPTTPAAQTAAVAADVNKKEVRKVSKEARRKLGGTENAKEAVREQEDAALESDLFGEVTDYSKEENPITGKPYTADEVDALIDAMMDEDLTTAFMSAAKFSAGRQRSVRQGTHKFASAEQQAQYDELKAKLKAGDTSVRQRLKLLREQRQFVPPVSQEDALKEVLQRFGKTPSEQKKLIKRVQNFLRRRAHGKAKGAPLTSEATRPEGSSFAKREKGLSTDVLTQETPRRDMSKTEKRELAERGKRTFKELDDSVIRLQRMIQNARSGEFASMAAERDARGNPTDNARNMIMARGYLRILAQYSDALQKANNRSSAKALSEIDKFNALVDRVAKMDAPTFARELSAMFSAEEREAVRGAARIDPERLGILASVNGRAKATAKANEKNLNRLRAMDRIETALKKDGYYNNILRPMMLKFAESIASNGHIRYTPTLQEMVKAQFAMRMIKARDTARRNALEARDSDKAANAYDGLNRFFKQLGINFEEKDENGKFVIRPDNKGWTWQEPDALLQRRYSRRHGRADEEESTDAIRVAGTNESAPKTEQMAQYNAQVRAAREASARNQPFTSGQVERLARMKSMNEAINLMRHEANRGSTVLDVVRAEEKFLRTMQELGLWKWTNKNIGLGRQTLPGFNRDTERSRRTVGWQLSRRNITKAEAVDELHEYWEPYTETEAAALKDTRSGDIAERMVHGKGGTTANREIEDELRELMRQKEMSPEQRRLLQALLDRDAKGLDADSIDLGPVRTGAKAIADLLESKQSVGLHDLLDRAIAAMPNDSPYRTIWQKIRDLSGTRDVRVMYDRSGDPKVRNIFSPATRSIVINRAALNAVRERGGDPSTALLHVLTHESVHAATHGAIENNPEVKAAMELLMRRTADALKARGLDPKGYYGTKMNDPHEFVAEAFSSHTFQKVLKETKVTPTQSVWQSLINLVKYILGVKDTSLDSAFDNAFDVIMSVQDHLFTGEMVGSRGMQEAKGMNLDDATRTTAANYIDKHIQSMGTLRGLWQQAKDKATQVLPAMTMEQIRDTYSQHFGEGDNPLSKYMRAFFKRNADASANKERATELSREWTKQAEQNPEAALELSRIMTEARLMQVHPDLPLSAPDNAHLTTPEQKAIHADLSKRWNALPEKMQDLYDDVAEYYSTTQQKEIALMTLNVLRGYLTTGSDAAMTEAQFNAKYKEGDVAALRLDTREGLEDEFGDELKESQLDTIHKTISLPSKRLGPYFPLTRYGDYVVYADREAERKNFGDRKSAMEYKIKKQASDPTLDVELHTGDGKFTVVTHEREFRTAETRTEAQKNRAEMAALYGDANVTPVQLKADLMRGEAAIKSNAGLRSILSKLDGNPAAQQAIKNYYLESLSSQSFRKHEAKSKNRRGVKYESQHRSFASYAKQASYYTAQLRYGWQMADALQGMEKVVREHRDESDISAVRMGEVLREIRTRDELTHNMTEMNKLVQKGVELGHFMLLSGPSYWMLNMTQPYMVSLPWLAARSSYGAAASALGNAQKLIASPLVSEAVKSWGGLKALISRSAAEQAFGVLDQVEKQIKARAGDRAGDYLKMLTDLKRESIIDLSSSAELRDMASGKQSMFQNVMDANRLLAHLTEVNNRVMTAIAAYDVARSKGSNHEGAVDFAKQAVSLTQFNYSSGNKPRLFQSAGPLGAWGPLAFQFMQYPQHMYALMISSLRQALGDSPEGRRIARKTLAGLFGTHLAAAGTMGGILQPVKWAIGLAAMMFGDDDEPFDFDDAMRKGASSLLGTDLGEVVTGGLPRLAGIDLSNRLSLGTLYQVDLKTDNADSFLGSLLQSFGGPLTGMVANVFRGAQYASQGDWWKASEMIEPKILKDFSKFARFSSEGLTNNRGETIMNSRELNPYQLALQGFGLQPSEISNRYARNQVRKDAQQFDEKHKLALLHRWNTASTPAERQQIAIEVAELAKRNPELGLTRSTLIRSMQGFKQGEQRVEKLGGNFRGSEALYAKRGEYYDGPDEEDDSDEDDLF